MRYLPLFFYTELLPSKNLFAGCKSEDEAILKYRDCIYNGLIFKRPFSFEDAAGEYHNLMAKRFRYMDAAFEHALEALRNSNAESDMFLSLRMPVYLPFCVAPFMLDEFLMNTPDRQKELSDLLDSINTKRAQDSLKSIHFDTVHFHDSHPATAGFIFCVESIQSF